MKPEQCILWKKPELIDGPLKNHFEYLKTFTDNSHMERSLLRCRECGQLYFYEFYEEIDWESGNDPQYITLIPVRTSVEAKTLNQLLPIELLQYSPRMQQDYKNPTLRWVGK